MQLLERIARIRDSLERLERGVALVEKDPQDAAAWVITKRELLILFGRVLALLWNIATKGVPPVPGGPEPAEGDHG